MHCSENREVIIEKFFNGEVSLNVSLNNRLRKSNKNIPAPLAPVVAEIPSSYAL